jgi:hypothetical protein
MATVSRSPAPVNVSSIAWHALAKVAAKEGSRDDLQPGSSHVCRLSVNGDIDGREFDESFEAILSVGHDTTKASSATPELPLLVANILAKLNAATRESVLRDLPEVFAANGGKLPAVDAAITGAAESMLQRLRAKSTVTARGAVTCKHSLRPSFALVG